MVAIFRYSLTQAPEARIDGSGCVDHQITAQYSEDDGSNWAVVPGRNKTFSLPAADLNVVLAMATGVAKNTAYKQLLSDNIDTQPQPVTGWTDAQLDALITANNLAAGAASGADTYITVTLGQSYPVPFQL